MVADRADSGLAVLFDRADPLIGQRSCWVEESAVIILGIILLVAGYLIPLPILITIGWILVVVGAILWILGAVGHGVGPGWGPRVGGRRYWW